MAFLAPLAAAAAPEVAAGIESIVGPEVASVLGPAAISGLKDISKSKKVKKGFSHLANSFFGSKHGKTARKLIQKADKVAAMATGKQAHKLLGSGLKLAEGVGVIDKDSAKKILSTHEKAMKLHDQLSHFNKKHVEGFGTGKTNKIVEAHKEVMKSKDTPMLKPSPPKRDMMKPKNERVINEQIHIPTPYATY